MKDCPKCHTKYTDVTLKFCLQDGAALVESSGEATEVFDAEAFSNDVTIAVSAQDTDPEAASTASEVPTQVSVPTPSYDTGAGSTDSDGGGQSKISFLSGFLVGALILGFLIVAVLGVWLLPGMLAGTGNTNTSITKIEKFQITSEDVGSITSSSFRKPEKGILYIPENIMDADVRTAWGEGVKGTGVGEWVKVDFGKKQQLQEVMIKPGYFKNASIWQKNNRVASVQLLFSNGQARIFDFPNEMKTQTIELEGINTSFVKMTIREIYKGSSDQEDTLISEIGFTAIK